MNDDFDKLRPPDDDNEDDDSLDWLPDDSKKKPGKQGEELGFTGQLDWRKDVEQAFNDQLGKADDDSFDWQQSAPSSGSSSSSPSGGFTGELDWKKVESSAPGSTNADDDVLDWMQAEPSEPTLPSEPTEKLTPTDDDEPIFEDDERPVPEATQVDPLAWMKELDAPPTTGEETLSPDLDDFAEIEENPLAWMQAFDDEQETSAAEAQFSPEPDDEEEVPEQLAWLKAYAPSEELEDTEQPAFDLPTTDSLKPLDEMPLWLGEALADAAPAAEEDDLFGGLDEALGISDVSEAAEDDIPDWLKAAAPGSAPVQESAPPAAEPEGDIFAQLGLPAVETGFDFLDEAPADERQDWFAEMDEAPAAADESPNWLQELGDYTEEEPAPAVDLPMADDDFLQEFRPEPAADDELPFPDFDDFNARGLEDIDKLLETYHDTGPDTAVSGTLSEGDLDRLLSDREVERVRARRGGEVPITGLSPDAPDWLTEIGASVGSVDELSAAAIVRKRAQKEKSLDELSDRLYALHEAGMDVGEAQDTGESEVIKSLLPGVDQMLSSSPVRAGLPGLAVQVSVTEAQLDKIKLLKNLVAIEDEKPRARPSAIDLTLDSPNLDDLLDEPDIGGLEIEEPVPAPVAARTRFRPKLDRLLVALLVTAAVILPFFVSSVRLGELPPAQFAAGSRGAVAYSQVDALGRGDLALVAAEYGPTGAAELDDTLDALLRHILMRGAKPVLVSGNAAGLLHARNVMENLTTDPLFLNAIDRSGSPLVANQDYYTIRFLVGEVIGLRAFSQDVSALVGVDVNGQPTNLNVASLRDFALVAVIAERGEDARAWAEQVAPLAGQPLLLASGFSAAPLVEPYAVPGSPSAINGVGGLLVGFRDAYTYREMLDVAMGLRPPLSVPESPTPTTPPPTAIPTTEPPPTQESFSVVPVEGTGTEIPPETSPTAEINEPTLQPTTAAPTDSLPATATPRPPSATPRPPTSTPTVTPTAGTGVRAVVNSSQGVNVREGAGRTFPPIDTLEPGTIVEVIGRDATGEWIEIRLDDGREGWISAGLLLIEEPELEPTPTQEGAFRNPDSKDVGLARIRAGQVLQEQPETTPEVTLEAVVETTPEATAEIIAQPMTVSVVAQSAPDTRQERWYGMTLGLMVIIVLIALGAVVNILRAVFGRGKA
ncbi:MAG: SH3 domain-containing protein [Anaerolineae bacterium]|nr:SH3 domain-containing protein [Anaerolineae bacterium]